MADVGAVVADPGLQGGPGPAGEGGAAAPAPGNDVPGPVNPPWPLFRTQAEYIASIGAPELINLAAVTFCPLVVALLGAGLVELLAPFLDAMGYLSDQAEVLDLNVLETLTLPGDIMDLLGYEHAARSTAYLVYAACLMHVDPTLQEAGYTAVGIARFLNRMHRAIAKVGFRVPLTSA